MRTELKTESSKNTIFY